jgi:hypothetical protein
MNKQLRFHRLLYVCVLILVIPGCIKDKITKTYTIMRPVYASKSQVLADINSGPVKELKSPGKIYIRGNYVFVNELDKGVHIIDNSNPSAPKKVSFISIPGNVDIAVTGHYLFADMYSDLLTIDIEDPLNVKLVDTVEYVFPIRTYGMMWNGGESQVIVDWLVKDTTIVAGEETTTWNCMSCDFIAMPDFASNTGGKTSGPVPGIAGSMSRVVVVNNYLYAVNESSLVVMNIDNPANVVRNNDVQIGWNIETIYPFSNHLFIGSTQGMFIFNIDNPSSPQLQAGFGHANSCDPVISDGEYAYVTLRSGNICNGFTNQLDVVDIGDLMNPVLLKTYPMSNPHGLTKDGDLLFICDGEDGVKAYDASDVNNITLIKKIDDLNSFDVIAYDGRILVSAESGLYQYDYSDPADIKLLSSIEIAGK